jgi:hypothetical protein
MCKLSPGQVLMPFDATQVLVLGSIATFAIWVWRFSSLLGKTARDMHAAALTRLATAMGTQFWKQGSPYQDELSHELGIDPNWIVHTLRWVNAQAEIFSFQEVRRGSKGGIYYHTWIGYRFERRLFPKFDLKAKGVVRSVFQGRRRRVSLTGQLEFTRRYLLNGDDKPLIEQFFSPDRCAAVLSRRWSPAVSIKASGHWLFACNERWLYSTSESDSEASVSKEMNGLLTLLKETLPLAEALTDSRLVENSQQYDNLSQLTSLNRTRPWWDQWVSLLLGVGIVILIIVLTVFLGELWDLFDKTILKTETRRYLFAILFFAAFWASGEWLIRFYRQRKQRAASRLASAG